MSAPAAPERTALYRLYDKRHNLLYVGITNDPRVRFAAHAVDKPWWPSVVRRDLEWFPSRAEALAAEGEAIRIEKPGANVLIPAAPKPPAPPREPALFVAIAEELRAKILSGEIAAGDKLPSENQLRAQYGISHDTAKKALGHLRNQGLVDSRQGAGFIVKALEDRTIAIPIGRPDMAAEMLVGAMGREDLLALAKLLDQATTDTQPAGEGRCVRRPA